MACFLMFGLSSVQEWFSVHITDYVQIYIQFSSPLCIVLRP